MGICRIEELHLPPPPRHTWMLTTNGQTEEL